MLSRSSWSEWDSWKLNIFISYSGNHKELWKCYLVSVLKRRLLYLHKNIPHFRNHIMSLFLILLICEQFIVLYLHLFIKCFPVLTSGPGEGQSHWPQVRQPPISVLFTSNCVICSCFRAVRLKAAKLHLVITLEKHTQICFTNLIYLDICSY